MNFKYNDGGRIKAGYKGKANDCVVRAIAIATEKPYQEIYDAINLLSRQEKICKHKKSSSRNGVYPSTWKKYLKSLNWKWIPTMLIGQGCKVHLTSNELPSGRIIARVSKHMVALINGVVHDTYDSSRQGTRCVYGYWIKKGHIENE